VDKNLALKHKKLFRKALYLSAELEEVNDVFEVCKAEFFKEVSETGCKPPSLSLASAVDSLDDNLEDILSEEDSHKPPAEGFKKLYRKIMLKAHPDKLIGIKDDDLRQLYSDVCAKTMKAMEEESWYMLYGAALDIGIKNIELKDEHINFLTEDCSKIDDAVKKIKSSIPWVWFHSNNNIKKMCIEQYSSKYS